MVKKDKGLLMLEKLVAKIDKNKLKKFVIKRKEYKISKGGSNNEYR